MEENKLNATTQQFITAKISGCALKHGSKTNSSIRQSNLQLQNEAALKSCRIRAVEHRKSAVGLPNAHPGLKNRILLNYTRIENAHRRTGRHFTGGAEKLCPETNFFSLIRIKPETSCKYVLYSVEFVYKGFACNVNSPMTLYFVRSRWHLLYVLYFNSLITSIRQ